MRGRRRVEAERLPRNWTASTTLRTDPGAGHSTDTLVTFLLRHGLGCYYSDASQKRPEPLLESLHRVVAQVPMLIRNYLCA